MDEETLPVDLAQAGERPKDTTWGLFGDQYELGTLNFLTTERVKTAAGLVRTGERFNLNLPLNKPPRGVESGARGEFRGEYVHTYRSAAVGLASVSKDEVLDNLNTQTSTQWDGLGHVRHPRLGHYNGVNDTDVRPGAESRLSIGRWVEAGGIVARSVLLDVERYCQANGIRYDPRARSVIDSAMVEAILAWEGVNIQPGDVLLVRTGAQSAETEGQASPGSAGLGPGREIGAFLWAKRVAAVASDTGAFEPTPIDPSGARSVHMQLLPMMGMPIGELFALDPLAAACARDRVYEFMFVSVPLNLPGGLASFANAVAIK